MYIYYIFKISYFAGRMAEVVERLPSKCETLSSNVSTAKKNFFKK
jgi:hypothetical protein